MPNSGTTYNQKNTLTARLSDYRDSHINDSIIVCGCGKSLTEFCPPDNVITIGVNDVGRLFDPTYLVVLNRRNQFSNDRFKFVESSRAKALFTQLELGVDHQNIVKFKLGVRGGIDLSRTDCLPYTQNSPYVALCLALYMGARRIGLIGVDFTNNHFFSNSGRHPLNSQLNKISLEYTRLATMAEKSGVEILNLSETSQLTAFAKCNPEEFSRGGQIKRNSLKQLNIVSYATTPVAGVPSILARCIDHATDHNSTCAWATNNYGNNVSFDGDPGWRNNPGSVRNRLQSAELVIVHNGKVLPSHLDIISSKPVIVMAHNYGWNVDQQLVKKQAHGVVVGQYQATLPEFRDWKVIPNPIPLWEENYQPGKKRSEITICYTPSGRHERYPKSHRLYWHSKGYKTTIAVLRKLEKQFSVRLEVIGDRQISHAASLAMKRRSHIVIDECVTGSYHRNSLEGLAAGCVVVNGVGAHSAVLEKLQTCAGTNSGAPFVHATLESADSLKDSVEKPRSDKDNGRKKP